MPNGRMRKAVDRSIAAAVNSGNVDLEKHAAPLAMLRFMADYLDTPGLETPAFRYVTPASFLGYCEKLGMTPDVEQESEQAPRRGSMGRMRGKVQAFGGGKTA